jgi:hypothetical protein
MNQPEKYKTNKSSLNKFLEKKEQAPAKRYFADSSRINKGRFDELRNIALKAHKDGDIETLARLEAVNCVIENGHLLLIKSNEEWSASRALEQFYDLQEKDKYDNMWRGQMFNSYWQASIYGSGNILTGSSLIQDEKWTVAGKTYATKTEFLLSRTELGRALL